MLKKSGFICAILTVGALCLATISAPAIQRNRTDRDRSLDCNDNWGNSRLVNHCEIREQTLTATGNTISVDGNKNGGVTIKGWDRGDIFIRARIQTAAETRAEALQLVNQIRLQTDGAQIKADGPENGRDRFWSVSYEIFVPHMSDLSLKTHNGGIGVADVNGRIEFNALNGGVSLRRLGGNVRGRTTNGGLSIDLDGNYWEGEGMDVETTNGGVTMLIPENYSARLETGTTNGGLNIEFPITLQGRIRKTLSLDLGSGGTTVRAITTNGGVTIKRKS